MVNSNSCASFFCRATLSALLLATVASLDFLLANCTCFFFASSASFNCFFVGLTGEAVLAFFLADDAFLGADAGLVLVFFLARKSSSLSSLSESSLSPHPTVALLWPPNILFLAAASFFALV